MGEKKDEGHILDLKTRQHGVVAKATKDEKCFPAILDNSLKIVVHIDIKHICGKNFPDHQFHLFGECTAYRCLAN